VVARFPDLSAGQVINRLIRTARQPDGGTARSVYYGFGVVDPLAALTTDVPPGPRQNPLLVASRTRVAAGRQPPSGPAVLAIGAVLLVVLVGGAAGTLAIGVWSVRRRPRA